MNPFYITVQSLPSRSEIAEEEKELINKGVKKEVNTKLESAESFSYIYGNNRVDVWHDGVFWYIRCVGTSLPKFITAKKEKAQAYAIDIVKWWMGEKTKYQHACELIRDVDINLDSYTI
jgi:hypothetical protein